MEQLIRKAKPSGLEISMLSKQYYKPENNRYYTD